MNLRRAITWAGLLLTLALSITAPLALADGPISLDQYRTVVAQAFMLADKAANETNFNTRQSLLNQAADGLNGVREIMLDPGARITINNDALVEQIRGAAADRQKVRDVRERLQALREALSAPLVQLNPDDQAKLRDIFTQPPFKSEEQDNWLLQRIQEILDEINRRLRTIFGDTVTTVFNMRDLIVLLGLVLVGLVLMYFVLSLRRNSAAEFVLPTKGADGEANLTSSTALNNAQRLAATGDYRSAVRQLYLSTLLWLDEHDRLRYDHSLTNREYLRAVSNAPALLEALKPVVDTFDRIWYGFAPINAHEFEQYRMQVETLRNI